MSQTVNLFLSFWRHATVVPQRNFLFHDLISRVFLRSLPFGIVVLGFLDALVYAHHKHRRDLANDGNFGDCMSGRVRFMTAITPAYAHAYQTVCFGRPVAPHYSFRLPKPKARYPFLTNDLTGIHTYTDLRGAQLRARRGGRIRCVSGQSLTVHKDVQ